MEKNRSSEWRAIGRSYDQVKVKNVFRRLPNQRLNSSAVAFRPAPPTILLWVRQIPYGARRRWARK